LTALIRFPFVLGDAVPMAVLMLPVVNKPIQQIRTVDKVIL